MAASRSRRFDEAAACFADWTALEPESAAAWLSLARVQAMAGLRPDARRSCDEALKRDASVLRAHLFSARLAATANDGKLRIAAMTAAVALRPAAVAMRLVLVRLLLRRIQPKAAMAVAKEALGLSPSDEHAVLAVARCHLALGHLVEAEALVERPQEAVPADAALAAERDRLRHDIAVRRARVAEASGDAAVVGRVAFVDAPVAVRAVPTLRGSAGRVRLAAVAESPPEPRPDGADARSGSAERAGGVTRAALEALGRARRRPGFVDHLLIVRALILRDIRLHHQNGRLGVLVELVRPAIVVFVHYWLFYLLHKPMPAQIPIEVYVLAGFSVWFAFNGAWLGASTGGKWPAGVTALPGVTDLHLRVAKAAWSLLLNLVFCLLALVPLQLFNRDLPFANVPETCAIFAMAGIMGFGFGLILERLGRLVSFIKIVEKLSTWALFVTSGLYFSVDTSPPVVAGYFLWNPLLHLVEYERHAFDPGYPVAMLDLAFPAVVAVVMLVTGLLLYGSLRCPAQD